MEPHWSDRPLALPHMTLEKEQWPLQRPRQGGASYLSPIRKLVRRPSLSPPVGDVSPSHRYWDRIDTGPQSYWPPMAGDFLVFVGWANSPRILGIDGNH